MLCTCTIYFYSIGHARYAHNDKVNVPILAMNVQKHNCQMCMVVSCCATGMAFTCSNVLIAVRTVEDWWGMLGLGFHLYIPEDKRREIQHVYSDPKEQLILYWMATDPLASWRRLIRKLDDMSQSPVADAIRDFAEPLAAGIYSVQINSQCLYTILTCILVYVHAYLCMYIHVHVYTVCEYCILVYMYTVCT